MGNLIAVNWCSLCNQREAHGTLTVIDPVEGEVPLYACVYCVANPDLWEDGKVVIKERPDE